MDNIFLRYADKIRDKIVKEEVLNLKNLEDVKTLLQLWILGEAIAKVPRLERLRASINKLEKTILDPENLSNLDYNEAVKIFTLVSSVHEKSVQELRQTLKETDWDRLIALLVDSQINDKSDDDIDIDKLTENLLSRLREKMNGSSEDSS